MLIPLKKTLGLWTMKNCCRRISASYATVIWAFSAPVKQAQVTGGEHHRAAIRLDVRRLVARYCKRAQCFAGMFTFVD